MDRERLRRAGRDSRVGGDRSDVTESGRMVQKLYFPLSARADCLDSGRDDVRTRSDAAFAPRFERRFVPRDSWRRFSPLRMDVDKGVPAPFPLPYTF